MEPEQILNEARKLIQQQGYDADMMITIPGVFGRFETHLFKGGPVGKVASETEKGSVVAFKACHVVAALFLLTQRAADLPHGGSLCEVTFRNGKVENIYPISSANR